MGKKIAALMTVFNRRDTTLRCLECLYKNTGADFSLDTYLVDDGSTDGTTEAVRANYPQVRIIMGDGNLYWNRGMLRSWQEAVKDNPDFYLWLNDDTFLYPNAIKSLLCACEQGGGECIISGSTRLPEKDVVTYGGFLNKRKLTPNGKLQKIDMFNGNCILIPQMVSDMIGLLDSYFHHSKGDWEYGIRALKHGIPLYIAPTYVGICERHDNIIPRCYSSKYNLRERIHYLYQPLGDNPRETLYYARKCLPFGLIRGVIYIILSYYRVFNPQKEI